MLHELRRNGYRSITMEGIARKIGCARASLYRRWPSKRHLVAYAVVSELGANPSPDTGSLRLDLMRTVETLVTGFQGTLGSALAGLVGEMADDPGLGRTIRKEVLAKRRRSIRATFALHRMRRCNPACCLPFLLECGKEITSFVRYQLCNFFLQSFWRHFYDRRHRRA